MNISSIYNGFKARYCNSLTSAEMLINKSDNPEKAAKIYFKILSAKNSLNSKNIQSAVRMSENEKVPLSIRENILATVVKNKVTPSEQEVCHIQTVDMGESKTVHDKKTLLFTEGLSSCCALIILSGKNKKSGIYQNRTLMHCVGGCLDQKMNHSKGRSPGFELLEKQITKLRSHKDGKFIMVGGDLASSDIGLSMVLGQGYSKHLIRLIDLVGTNVEMAGSSFVTLNPDGTFLTDEFSRGVLSKTEVRTVLELAL